MQPSGIYAFIPINTKLPIFELIIFEFEQIKQLLPIIVVPFYQATTLTKSFIIVPDPILITDYSSSAFKTDAKYTDDFSPNYTFPMRALLGPINIACFELGWFEPNETLCIQGINLSKEAS